MRVKQKEEGAEDFTDDNRPEKQALGWPLLDSGVK